MVTALRVDSRPLRNPPDDPVVRDRMLHSTGLDPRVRDYVLSTPGAEQLIERSLRRAPALPTLLALPSDGQRVDIHVLCAGGRHRSAAVAEELARRIRRSGYGVETEHLYRADHPHAVSQGSISTLQYLPSWRAPGAGSPRSPRVIS